ncbi:MAG: hypothetical protein OES24_18185 [Acidimicrobiia bacterium]|nr:hypothetical protein [Acidimicrobiia bacterium]
MIGTGVSKQDEPGARARLVRRVVFVVIGTLLGLAAGVAVSSSQPPRYESTMQLLVGPVGADRSTLDAAGLLSRTYADLLSSRNAVNRAAESLGISVDDGDVSASADDKSRVILLVVTGDEPSTPPRLATTLAADLIVLVEGSQQQSADGAVNGPPPGQVRVLDDATDPAVPVGSRSILTVIGTSILGAGIGLALGGLAPRSRRRPVDRQYLELLGLDVFSLQNVTRRRRRRRLIRRRPAKQVANKLDEYELIFQQLLIKGIQLGPFRTMLFVPVTEDLEGDVAKLMAVLAQAGHRLSCSVELADLDPDLRLLSTIDPAIGVEIVDPIDLDTESGVKRIARISETSDSKLLFLAAPAVGTSVRALTAVPAVDRIVLAVRSGQTERRNVRRLLDDLARLNSRPAAVLELDRGELIMATSVSSSMGRLENEVTVIGDLTSPIEIAEASDTELDEDADLDDDEFDDDDDLEADEFDDDDDLVFDEFDDDDLEADDVEDGQFDGDVEGGADARSDDDPGEDPDDDDEVDAKDEDRIDRRSTGMLALFDDRRPSKL